MHEPEIVQAVCRKCGLPVGVVVNGEPFCLRKHPGDPPDWNPKQPTLTERLVFYKEQKRG